MNLFLIVKKQYFDEIAAETKKEEYRLVSPHWVKKLVGRDYTHIIFQNGYNKNSPRLKVEYKGYNIRNIRHPFFGNDDVCVFSIQLGKVEHIQSLSNG